MAKRFAWVLMALMVGAGILHAFHALAESSLISVTKATQARVGVDFTLSAVRVSATAVLVRMEIPPKGKLKNLKTVTLDIGTYPPGVASSPLLSANLQTTPGKEGSRIVSFQLSPDLADKCSIRLGPLDPAIPEAYEYYSVELKGYVTNRK